MIEKYVTDTQAIIKFMNGEMVISMKNQGSPFQSVTWNV